MTAEANGFVLHRGLEEHAPGGQVASENLDAFLRVALLFNRGLVVTDSDLNNNPLFHAAFDRDPTLFEEALRDGHLLRAARIDPRGDVGSQRQLFANLKRRNAVRAAPVPHDHPGRLDRLLKTARPLTWSSDRLTTIFHIRCTASLLRARSEEWLTGAAAELATEVIDFLAGFPEAGAADIEQRFHVQRASPAPSWPAVWRIVLDAWGGNVAYAFDGELMVAQSVEMIDGINPSGPDSSEVLVRRSADYYRAIERGDDEDFDYVTSLEPRSGDHPFRFRIRPERLMTLSLKDIGRLRDAAGIDDLMALRATALRSPDHFADVNTRLGDAALQYWDRLASKDLAYELQTEWIEDEAATRFAAVQQKRDRRGARVTLSRTIAGQVPGVGILVSLLDAAEAVKALVGDRRAALADEFRRTTVHRIPDYRVIERLADPAGGSDSE